MNTSKKTTVAVSLLFGIAALTNVSAATSGSSARSHSSTRSSTAREVYTSHCAVCHGSTGTADTPVGKAMNAADLASQKIQRQSNSELAHFIATGEGQMPAFRNVLTHEEILGQVRYIRLLARKNK